MYLNDKEEKIIEPFLTTMERAKQEDLYQLEWPSGAKIIGYCDTIYESDNNLELDDPNYEEFWAIAVQIVNIIKSGPELGEISEDNIIEITYHNVPQKYKKI